MKPKDNSVSRLHGIIDRLQQQVKERDDTIKKLRKELEILGYKKANQEWVELDG